MINNIDELKAALLEDKRIVVSNSTDLRGVNLRGAYLKYSKLSNIRLTDGDLSYTSLHSANLSSTVLSGTNLRFADLRNANLVNTNLSYSNLFGVNLSGADLIGASLRGADLRDANLQGVNLRHLSAGNGKEVLTIESSRYKIVYTSDTLAIGCKQYPILDWQSFTDDRIAAMDTNALEWWRIHKPLIMAWIAANPATPHGGHVSVREVDLNEKS